MYFYSKHISATFFKIIGLLVGLLSLRSIVILVCIRCTLSVHAAALVANLSALAHAE